MALGLKAARKLVPRVHLATSNSAPALLELSTTYQLSAE